MYKLNCLGCNKEYTSKYNSLSYCDLKCRIKSNVDICDKTGCWNWKLSTKSGYGQCHYKGRNARVHRLSYEAFIGPISNDLIRHKCDNRLCCNPNHLEEGTTIDNVRDHLARGKNKLGLSYLTDEQILYIKYHEDGSKTKIAKKYNISQGFVSNIKRGNHRRIDE